VSSITASDVRVLRERTGAGMMDCKRALTEVDGDIDAAVALLREKGLAGAAKKAGRVTAEGLVGVFANDDNSCAVVVELNCETDFVAKNENFASLLDVIGPALLAAGGDSIEGGAADAAAIAVASGATIEQTLKDAISAIGENITLRRFCRIHCESGRVGSYVHAGGKIGVLVEIDGAADADAEVSRSIAMQVAAAMPRYVKRDQVDGTELEQEREIFRNQALASGKPDNVIDRIVDGKVEKFYRETCLLEQDYVRDSQLTISKLLDQVGKDGGRELSIKRFVRYQLGEGIEKRAENLAEEVAAQIGKAS